jgi:hypothetical protein
LRVIVILVSASAAAYTGGVSSEVRAATLRINGCLGGDKGDERNKGEKKLAEHLDGVSEQDALSYFVAPSIYSSHLLRAEDA